MAKFFEKMQKMQKIQLFKKMKISEKIQPSNSDPKLEIIIGYYF